MVRALGGRDVKAVPLGGINATHLARAMNVLKKFTTVARVEDLGNAALEDKFRRDFGWHTFKVNMTLLHAMYPNQIACPKATKTRTCTQRSLLNKTSASS